MIFKSLIYNVLGNPLIYRLSQLIFAPGADYFLARALFKLKEKLNAQSGPVLDLGCGPSSWLWKLGMDPVGLDILHSYSIPFRNHGSDAVTGSATTLPFTTDSFSTVFTLGVLHHLDDISVSLAINEMIRVCKPGGHIVIMDAVLPEMLWLKPLAHWIRKMDRGQFMRRQSQLMALLPNKDNWSTKRYTYAATGLELLECSYNKQ